MNRKVLAQVLVKTLIIAYLAAATAFIIKELLLEPFFVWGQSMEPTFQNYDSLLVDKVSYRFREPKKGEVVIFHSRESASVFSLKRVIGLPGESIKVYAGKVYVNGQELDERHYLGDGVFTNNDMEKTIGEGEYFVLGDNRTHSYDSRRGGTVYREQIDGRVVLRVLPLKRFGVVGNPFK